MLQIPDIEKKDLSSLMNVFYGGEGMTEEAENSVNLLLKKCGCNFALKKGLGMTEVTSAATVTFDNVNDFESVGVPLPKMNCKIVQPDTFDEVTYGEQGEVCFYGPTLMLGYYEHKQETDDLLRVHPDGKRWLHTGDLAYLDEKGCIHITGRSKNVIVLKNGKNVYPEEIETIIAELPYVKENIVFGEVRREGADDKDEVLVAKIVYDEDIMKDVYNAVTGEQIRETVEKDIDRINSNMPKYKNVHRLILQTEEMAKTTTGKVKRYEEKVK
jgi:long-chain acyl-CoA synthetase